MKQRVYKPASVNPATIAPATEMVQCDLCGYKLTPSIPSRNRAADDVVRLNRLRVCVRCGMVLGVVVCEVE